jgi:rubrerythrin
MNVYEYAMKVEKEGEAFYREMVSKSPNSGLKKIFTILADEEVKHYNVFKTMRGKENIDFDELDLITDTKTIFQTLLEEKDNVSFDNDQISYYKEAIAREESAYNFYAAKAKELDNEVEKKIFLHIAEEEIKHKKVLEEIVSFLEEPTNWQCSAEF